MKNLLYILFIVISLPLHSQWVTIKGENYHNHSAFFQFTIDPYTNNLWFVDFYYATVFEPDGTFITFGENELGSRWGSDELNFGFTHGHTFFSKQLAGLYLFDNYQKQLLYTDNNLKKIYFDGDTLFIDRSNDNLLKYTLGVGAENTSVAGSQISSKDGSLYVNIGSYSYYENGTHNVLTNDPFYIWGPTDVLELENESDTIYLGFINGISKFHNGIGYDTITPNNTTNMPSPNILEIEFDKNNNLWVAFGDANDDFIALGKLEN